MISVKNEVLQQFAVITTLPPIRSITQRGRDLETTTITLTLADGRQTTFKSQALQSQAKFRHAVNVGLGETLAPMKPADYLDATQALFAHAIDVREAPEDTLAARVEDWLEQYARSAVTDRDSACTAREPYKDEAGLLHVHAESFSLWVKRRYAEPLNASDLRQALEELGYRSTQINYYQQADRGAQKRTVVRYYRSPPGAEANESAYVVSQLSDPASNGGP